MPTEPLKLFYCYARADVRLRKRLDDHLAILKREGVISEWHDGDISAGQEWEGEIHQHLEHAHLILLLISSSFLASDYCYDIEMQKALEKQETGTARVIPIILRECDWKIAPFRKLQALPSNGKSVTMWRDKDAAFADIARGIRGVAENLNGTPSTGATETMSHEKRRIKGRQVVRERNVGEVQELPDTLGTHTKLKASLFRKAIDQYCKELAYYKEQAKNELGVRTPFQNLLVEAAHSVGWKLSPERTLEKGIRPDAILRDVFDLRRGFWEAKGPEGDLDKEINEKIKKGYPLTNIIFENTQRAVLYQNKKPFEYDLTNPDDISDLLIQFLSYTEPDIANFEAAIKEFQGRIPQLAKAVLKTIEDEYKNKHNTRFKIAFDDFTMLCRNSVNPYISSDAIKEMLVQHLLTERLFRTIFNNPGFVNRNIIAAEIEKVIQALTIRAFDRQEFLQPLDRFYVAIESAAKGIESWSERQHFLNTVYEHFFKGFSVKQADIHGIVYTPQEIADFMCASVEEVLKHDFDNKSLGDKGVQILDPAVGTGNFIVNLIRHYIPRENLQYKYENDLFCNEITLLPYYIASLNIEHQYFEKMRGGYAPFEGICFADTLELTEELYNDGADILKQSKLFMVEGNTKRVEKENAANISIVIGNPPYNMGQKNENDNSKNRSYPVIDQRINKTYVKDSKATLHNKLYDAYVRFFRYATDRLRGPGIVCFISNNSFVDQIAFDGMRKHLLQDFNILYHLDLHGNVRKNPKLSGTTHNVFGIQVGVGITVAVKTPQSTEQKLYYYRVPEFWTKVEKLTFLVEKKNITHIEWTELQPDENCTWTTQSLHPEFRSFLPIGTKEAKSAKGLHNNALFQMYSLGVATNRDEWVCDFDRARLTEKVRRLIRNYNSEVFRWSQEEVDPQILNEKANALKYIDNFVNADPSFVKWTDRLKEALYKKEMLKFDEEKIRLSLHRPFSKQFLYFDHLLNQRRYRQPIMFPTSTEEEANTVICLTTLGSEKPFMALATDSIPDLHLVGAGAGAQCFPYYTYSDDGSNRKENITDWAQKQFQAKYGSEIIKRDIFHYTYAILHHPKYREYYAEDLKRSLPYIPLVQNSEVFWYCASIGKQLMTLHVNYDKEKEYDLTLIDNETLPYDESRSVQKMQLSPDQTAVIINKSLTLKGIPQEYFQYRLGIYPALEWVIDQYQVTKDKQGRIINDPNRLDDKDYIIRLIKQVVAVSVQTVRLVNQLAQMVNVEDWMDGSMAISETARI